MELKWRKKTLWLKRGTLMGILNITPDSFSDGGQFLALPSALARAKEMLLAGAAILDVGGESSQPAHQPVGEELELARVIPVIEALSQLRQQNNPHFLISIDTRKAGVAQAALKVGADLVNDVTGLRDPVMRAVCAEFGVPAVLMHMRGTPETLDWSQESQPFTDVVREVRAELAVAARYALEAGVPSVILDPGFGFGKSVQQNLELIRGLPELKTLGYPILLGASRKSTLGHITSVASPVERDAASIAAHLFGLMRGADMLRVHNVAGHAQAVKVWRALEEPTVSTVGHIADEVS